MLTGHNLWPFSQANLQCLESVAISILTLKPYGSGCDLELCPLVRETKRLRDMYIEKRNEWTGLSLWNFKDDCQRHSQLKDGKAFKRPASAQLAAPPRVKLIL